MTKKHIRFSQAVTDFYFDAAFATLKTIADPAATVLLTDEHVYNAHPRLFKNRNVIVLKPGEQFKVQSTVDEVIQQLIAMKADRSFTLVGVGGGVITDLAGYIASVYMRGIRFGFVPTTLLALVDASIGGKNGIDVGDYKNLVGVIRQPSFILHDYSLLRTLPDAEWRNGFAEIIKHAAIRDAAMFRKLLEGNIAKFRKNKKLLADLIRRNALLKAGVVQKDEFETGDRRLLNFGHTLGHALETQYELSHGEAISIGMTYAVYLSALLGGFRHAEKVVGLLEQYGLPTFAAFDLNRVMTVMKMDKKRERSHINYVLLERIGKGIVQPVSVNQLSIMLQNIQS